MRTLVWDASFRRAFKRRTRNDSRLQERIFETLALLVENPFAPSLKTHKLRGQLEGLWACWVEYDCRIVFEFGSDSVIGDVIVLVDLGTHDEVY
jgi:mRNA interferase YafQ